MNDCEQILQDLANVRSLIRDRLIGMNGMTEREVLAAGASLDQVVNHARSHVTLIRGVLEATADEHSAGSGAARAAVTQSAAMRAFLDEMTRHLGAQKEHAASAYARSTEIGSTAKAVAALARAAHILTLNAKIETARMGGGVFSAISEEMKKLSREVQSTNAEISALAVGLAGALPQISEIAGRMEALTGEFSVRLAEGIERVQEEERQARAGITAALEAGDEVLAQVLAAAAKGLSHLQFQDSVAQGLLEIDSWLYKVEGQMAAKLGRTDEAHPRLPPLQQTLGGAGSYDRADAGELTLL